MPWMPDCPTDPVTPFGYMVPIAITLHRTYGFWPGDYLTIKNRGLCQFLIGKDDGHWVEFMDTNGLAYHCDGANWKAVGIELEGVNAEALTDWQLARLGDVLRFLAETHGIPLVYLDPAVTDDKSVWVDGGGFAGVLSHSSVRPDEGASTPQHTDAVTAADFARALAPPVTISEESDVYLLYNPDQSQVVVMGDTQVDGFDPAQLVNADKVLKVLARTQAEFDATIAKRTAPPAAPPAAGGPAVVIDYAQLEHAVTQGVIAAEHR